MGKTKAHCPQCGRVTRCFIKSECESRWESEDGQVWDDRKHYVVECGGCEFVFFHLKSYFSEDLDYIIDAAGEMVMNITPNEYSFSDYIGSPSESWLGDLKSKDYRLFELLNDAMRAKSAGLDVLSVVGLRICFDRFCEISGIEIDKPFSAKLESLLEENIIGKPEYEILKVLIDAANAAAHRGWEPGDTLNALFAIVESVFKRRLIIDTEVEGFRSSIPKRGE